MKSTTDVEQRFEAALEALIKKAQKDRYIIAAVLSLIDAYLTDRIPQLFQPVLDYLRDAGTIRSATDIDAFFAKQIDINNTVTACEWLADKGILTKASSPVRLTQKSQTEFDELAFYYDEDLFGVQ